MRGRGGCFEGCHGIYFEGGHSGCDIQPKCPHFGKDGHKHDHRQNLVNSGTPHRIANFITNISEPQGSISMLWVE